MTPNDPAAKSFDASEWTIYIANDNCPDYTWGFPEDQTRRNMAEIVAAHLDEMRRTDREAPENQARYNMAVTQEALCFLERYPHRKQELIGRIKEGRLFMSPFLCNTLWGSQSVEGVLRAFYPACRLQRDWGIRIEVAEHIELPSLPWGVATLLEGCGIGWLSIPFLDYDSTFADLRNLPLFIFEGPDGSRIRVIMDSWASHQASYVQGGKLLQDPALNLAEWLPHYPQLGAQYPLKAVFASGTHGDLMPESGGQARGFADAVARYNASPGPHPTLVNGTLAQFCKRVDEAERKRAFLTVIRGCFGHSWELWPVSLAKLAAEMRENERQFLSVEALTAVVSREAQGLAEATRADRERAEWCWAMLADHAWNGTDDENKRHNADLRANWNQELGSITRRLLSRASAACVTPRNGCITLFNGLSIPRADLVSLDAPTCSTQVAGPVGEIDTQIVAEDDRIVLCFVSPEVPGYGFSTVELRAGPRREAPTALKATPASLDGPYYSLVVDPRSGGISSLIQKATGADLVAAGGRTLGQTVYFDGQEHTLTDVVTDVAAVGPVLARLRVRGAAAGIQATSLVTLYAALDRVDLDLRVEKPMTTVEERLCHFFPVLGGGDRLRVETPGAVITPRPQPEGDLLPGGDPRRVAVQGFLDVSRPGGGGLRIAPLDAFALRLDLGDLCFEALGNDQNYREVTRDQHGVTGFRFRYSLCGYDGPYNQARAVAWSRTVASPLLAAHGTLSLDRMEPPITVSPERAIATCLKPADDPAAGGTIVRLWETAGHSGPLTINAPRARRALRVDLLERDLEEVEVRDGEISIALRGFGYAALRLLPYGVSCIMARITTMQETP